MPPGSACCCAPVSFHLSLAHRSNFDDGIGEAALESTDGDNEGMRKGRAPLGEA